MAELTPMKRQYLEIKQQHPDCLLFFRLGDFYEMFDDDAKLASRELDLALTTRDRNIEDPEERTPMCGVPYHSAEAYIARLIAKGYKVAICEQMEDPALAKGLVQREVIRIITPGTVTESSMLEEGRSNYIAAVFLSGDKGGAAFCDVSTGEFCCANYASDAQNHILNELGRFAPREALLSPGALDADPIGEFLTRKLDAMLEAGPELFEYMPAAARVCRQFGFSDVDESGLGEDGSAVCAAGALLAYLEQTQKFDLSHISRLDVFYGGRYMELDWATRRSLELTESLRSGEKRGTLLWVLDRTRTPMGGRMLRAWVERPLLSVVAIKRRLAAVNELVKDHVTRGELILALKEITDLQRLVGRCVYGSAGGKDLRAIAPPTAGTCWRWGTICPCCRRSWAGPESTAAPCSPPWPRPIPWRTRPSCCAGPSATSRPSPSGRGASSGRATARRWTGSGTSASTAPSGWPSWRPGSGSAPASKS